MMKKNPVEDVASTGKVENKNDDDRSGENLSTNGVGVQSSSIESVETDFAAFVEAEGYGPHHIPADGQWHGFDRPGERGKKCSAKLTFGERPEGVVKDFRTGEIKVWKGEKIVISPEQMTEHQRKTTKLAAEKKDREERSRQDAWLLYQKAGPASPDHPYLVKKKITGTLNHLKQDGDRLVIALYNCGSFEFQTVQFIHPDGTKLFPKDSVTRGACCRPFASMDGIDKLPNAKMVICEGWAKGVKIEAAMKDYIVVCAMSKDNMTPVAEAMRNKGPFRHIAVAPDHEHPRDGDPNPGMTAAVKAAVAAKCHVCAAPPTPGTDFDDLYDSDGPEAVKKFIDAAYEPSAPELAQPEAKPKTTDQGSQTSQANLILTNEEFVAGFQPPDYLIDGLIQRRFLYSITAPTNAGKTAVALYLAKQVATGSPLGSRAVEKGKVLYFAGENPDDIRMRWIKQCDAAEITEPTVFWITGRISISKIAPTIAVETKRHGPFSLILIDTAAVYFEGDDENTNTQFGNYARLLRSLVTIYGGPTVIVLCHPVKNANPENLIPRGGGAFIAEVDGNLVLKVKSELPKIVELHWQGKFRGPDFEPITFKIEVGTSERIKDSRGNKIPTVTARTLTKEEIAAAENVSVARQNSLLKDMQDHESGSFNERAKRLGWFTSTGELNKTLVKRVTDDLVRDKLAKKEGHDFKLTSSGKAAKVTKEVTKEPTF